MKQVDVVIVGGGIVGAAVADALKRQYPRLKAIVLEKEVAVARHQSGRNSGVLHSGIYYKPGSLKAINCRVGREAMESFCTREGIPFHRRGKVIVAARSEQLPMLDQLAARGEANGVACERISLSRLAELEPAVRGVGAIHVPGVAVVDFAMVTRRLAERFVEQGGQVWTGARVSAVRVTGDGLVVETHRGDVQGKWMVNCAGLQCDRVARLCGVKPAIQIVPFRGEYRHVVGPSAELCRGLIYPVPDPSFPFLGVHLTRGADGSVHSGPNAVLALAREGYGWEVVHAGDLWETVRFGGFRKLVAGHWRAGLGEMHRSLFRRAFGDAVRMLVPGVRDEDLQVGPSGVRAQAVTAAGALADDFLIADSPHAIHVLNAPSPAATSSLNIAKLIVDRLAERMGEPPTENRMS